MPLYENQEYEHAKIEFEKISSYRDSRRKIQECIDGINETTYLYAIELLENGEYDKAEDIFKSLDSYKESAEKVIECENSEEYDRAMQYLSEGSFDVAKDIFVKLEAFRDSAEKVQEWSNVVKYYTAENYWKTGYYQEALNIFSSLGSFYDSEDRYNECFEDLKDYSEVITILRSYSDESDYTVAFKDLNWKLLEKNGNTATLICLDYTYGFHWEETTSQYDFMIRQFRRYFNENEIKHVKKISLPSRDMLEDSRPFDDDSVLSIDHFRTINIDGYIEKRHKSSEDWWYIRPVIEVSLN
ncbi:MAG: hypothetical protein MJ107_01530 [Lachnospiraceae bacterium]|nr:hypothetical protein [Lachnospiraceae bacterium]